jgi:hypothetical protein
VTLESGWMDPPLHRYLCPEDARLPAEQLLVQLWRTDRCGVCDASCLPPCLPLQCSIHQLPCMRCALMAHV